MSESELPRSDGENFKATYENYEVACPICKRWNVFNRITDIKSVGAASGKRVTCLRCNKDFRIVADNVEEKYEYFLEDCEDLLRQKKYIYCILTLCQACEAFFMKCIDVKLLWEPYRRGVFGLDDSKFRVFDEFYDKISKEFEHFPYRLLLNIFFDLYLNGKTFGSQEDIISYLNEVNKFARKEPTDCEIKSQRQDHQCETLLALKRLNINEMRNSVAHKDGYRPTREEVEQYYMQVIAILNDVVNIFELGRTLKYCDISNVMELMGK